MNTKVSVGKKIRSLRESKEMEIEVLAERAQLPVEQIKAIENDGPLPGLAPLIKIARVLGVRLGTFLDDQQGVGAVVSRHEEERESVRFSNHGSEGHENMIYHSLSEGKENRHIEPFVIDILPAGNAEFAASSHEGEEFIYVLDGLVEVVYGKNTYLLEKGDSIYYDSIVRHHVHGFEGQQARILAVVYTPI
ncbi:MAG: cupin domain-containing protein [Bacteroidaceae bacterium]|nr:cupin domain-containing protein [Candidatus Colenecus caballi]MCQ2073159.1 cupin domain-containing protein [Bacteroidaceae bacterium]